jgi:cytosine/adenosine deaminase-related metal-dependent hydrolase
MTWGRLAPGAKADIVLIAMRTLRMGPYRDPIKALVQCGTGDDVRRVIVDGRTVVEGGHVVGVDETQVLADAQREAERLWAEVAEWHWQNLTAAELSPPSFPPLAADLQE